MLVHSGKRRGVVPNRFGIYPLVEGPGRQVYPKTTTFCLVLGFTTSTQPSKAHQSQNDLEQRTSTGLQLPSTTPSWCSLAKECLVPPAGVPCGTIRMLCAKTFGEQCALQASPEGVLSPNAAKLASLVTNVPSTCFYEGCFHQTILNKCQHSLPPYSHNHFCCLVAS